MKQNNILSPEYVQIVENDSVLLVSTERVLKLNAQLAKKLLPLLDGCRTEDEIVDEMLDSVPMSELYYTLEKLRKAKAVLLVSSSEASVDELFDTSIGIDSALLPRLVIVNLCDEYESNAQAFYNTIEWQGEKQFANINEISFEKQNENALYIVVTPGYLHTELLAFNIKARETQITWLPVKVSGVEFYAGPMFRPNVLGCMQCVATQNEMHHPDIVGHPFYSNTALRFFAAKLEQYLQRSFSINDNKIEKGVIAYNFKEGVSTYHAFTPTSSCPICGVRTKTLPDSKPQFQAFPKIGYIDGGDRIISAKESLKQFQPLVSSLTGVVSCLSMDERWSDSKGGYWLSYSQWGICKKENHLQANSKQECELKNDHTQGRITVTGTSVGKGRTEEQAQMSAIGEAMERYSTQYFGYEEVINASYAELGKEDALDPHRLACFSHAQYANREAYYSSKFGKVPEPCTYHDNIDWAKCYSVSEDKYVYIPASYAFYSYPKERGGKFFYANSNGVSGGNCLEEAFLQGVYELTERDGTSLWWYNELQYPALDLDAFADKKMQYLIDSIRKQGHTFYALDLTPVQPGIPVIVAVVMPKGEHQNPCFGLGSHLDVRIALDRAMSEVVQGLCFLDGKVPEGADEDWWSILQKENRTAFLKPSSAPLKRPEDYICKTTDTLLGDIEVVLEKLKECGMDCYIHNLTREETQFSVCRVIVPDLLHFWPRFGHPRLYSAPVEFGWLDKAHTEEELNPHCVPF